MAICYHNISYGNLNRSSAHAVGYITGTAQLDVRTNIVRDYSNRKGVLASGRVVPEDAPEWAKDANSFWNAIDLHVEAIIDKKYRNPETNEYFKNKARTNQRHVLSLPIELAVDEHKDIHVEFVQKLIAAFFTPLGAVVDWAIHNDPGNPHVHLFSSLHMLKEGELSQTVERYMYSPEFCKNTRKFMETHYNPILEEKGIEGRVNSKSYQEMGVEIVSQIHEGPFARYLAEQGRGTRVAVANEEIRSENGAKILMNTQNMTKLLAANFSTFTRKTAFQFIYKHMNEDEHTTALVFERVMKDVVKVSGVDEDTTLYVTKLYKAQEDKAVDMSSKLFSSTTSLLVSEEKIEAYLAKKDDEALKKGLFALSDEQKNAVRLFCGDKQLSVLVGRAGTGKTTATSFVVELLKAEGIEVFGASMAAEAAHNLEKEAHIPSTTIDSFLFSEKMVRETENKLKNTELTQKERAILEKKLHTHKNKCLKQNCALIVDEAGMVGVEMYSKLFDLVKERNVKLMLVGDDRQLKSVSAGDMFRHLVQQSEKLDAHSSITRIFRQKEQWMSQASIQFSEMDVRSALKSYDEGGYLHKITDEAELLEKMVDKYLDLPDHASSCVLAYTNETVDKLNKKIRSQLQAQGRLSTSEVDINGNLYAVGDSFVFLKNTSQTTLYAQEMLGKYLKISGKYSQGMKVRNGMRGTILSIEEIDADTLKIIGANEPQYKLEVLVKEKGEDHVVAFLTNSVEDFTHGYATTLYKSQGQTVDVSLLYVNKMLDHSAAYVAFTRHREEVHAYYLESEFPTFETLCNSLSKVNSKHVVADFDHETHDSEVIDTVNGYKDFGYQIGIALSHRAEEDLYHFKNERRDRALELLADFPKYGPMLLAKGVTKYHLEKAAGLVERALSQEEISHQPLVEAYIHVHQKYKEVREEIEKTHSSIHSQHHEDYAYLQQLQERRGELALALKEKSNLTRAFSQDIYEGCGYGLSVIDVQAERYQIELLKKETLSKLSYEDKSLLSLYEDGIRHMNEGVKLYKKLKAYDDEHLALKEGETRKNVIFKTMNAKESIEQKEYLENAGSGAMYYFETHPHLLARVHDIINTFDPLSEEVIAKRKDAAMRFSDKLLIAKAAGVAHVPAAKDAEIFLHTHPITDHIQICNKAVETVRTKLEAAVHLTERLKIEKQENDKLLNEKDKRSPLKARVMREVGFEGLLSIYNNAREGNRLRTQSLFGRENINGELIALVEYSQAKQEASRLWKRVSQEAQERGCKIGETSLYAESQKAGAQKDIAAFFAVETYGADALNRVNAFMKEKELGLRLDNMEAESERGRIHDACQVFNDINAPVANREDARETLILALMIEREENARQHTKEPELVLPIDELADIQEKEITETNPAEDTQSAQDVKTNEVKKSSLVYGIMSSHLITPYDLEDDLCMTLTRTRFEAFTEELPAIEAYQKALRGFSKAYSALLKAHPKESAKALNAKELSPQALGVLEAIKERNEAAYQLQQLNILQNHDEKNLKGLFKGLRLTQQQFLQHSDEHESHQLAGLFKSSTDEEEKKKIAIELTEKMYLQNACNVFNTVRAALIAVDLRPKDITSYANHLSKYPLLNKDQQARIKAFEIELESARKLFLIVKEEFNQAKQAYKEFLELKEARENDYTLTFDENGNYIELEHKRRPRISYMPTYGAFWEANIGACEIAYHLVREKDVLQSLSKYDNLIYSRYGHQFEMKLTVEAYQKAKDYGNPIACLIARELIEVKELENAEWKNNKALTKGTYGVVFACKSYWSDIYESADEIVDAPIIMFKDIEYLNSMSGSYLPGQALKLLRNTTFTSEYMRDIKRTGYFKLISEFKEEDMLTHQERDMVALKEAQALQRQISTADKKEKAETTAPVLAVTKPAKADAPSRGPIEAGEALPKAQTSKAESIISVTIDNIAKKAPPFKKTKASTPKKENTFFQLTDEEKKQISNEYKEKFSDLVDYPSRAQDLLIRELFHGSPKLKKKGIYSFGGGWEYHPDGIGGRTGKSVFKSWTQTHDNLGIYDVAEMKGYCSNYSDFMKRAGDLIGFRSEDYFKERLAEIKAMRGGRDSNASITAQSADFGKQSTYIPFADALGGDADERASKPRAKDEDGFTPLAVVPQNRAQIYPSTLASAQKNFGEEKMRFAYRTEKGELMGYVIRFEKEGQKSPVPFAFCSQANGPSVWRYKRFNGGVPGTYPIYGLEKLRTHPHAPILFVEGEKAADAAQKLFPDIAVMSWIGGAAGTKRINFAPVTGRDIMMWPDNDEAGFNAANLLKEKLDELDTPLHIINIPRDKLPEKWDLADALPEGVTFEEVRGLIHKGASQLRASKAVLTPLLPVPQEAVSMMPHDISTLITQRQAIAVHDEQGNLLHYKLSAIANEKENEAPQTSNYLMYCAKGEAVASWQVVDDTIFKTIAKAKNTNAVIPLHGLEKLKNKASDQPIIIVHDDQKAKSLQQQLAQSAIVLGAEKEYAIKQFDLTPLKGQTVSWMLNQGDQSLEELKRQSREITYFQPQARVMAADLDDVKPQKILKAAIEKQAQTIVEKKVDVLSQSQGLFSHALTFDDVKETIERYQLADLLQGRDAKHLNTLTYQSMVNLQSLTSWATILNHEKDLTILKDQAVLSSLLSDYAKQKLSLGQDIQGTIKAKGIGFDMAREALNKKQGFNAVMDTVLETASDREDSFEKEMGELLQKRGLARRNGENVLDPHITQSVDYQSQYCKASFGENLPPYVINHLQEVLYAHNILAQKENAEIDSTIRQQLMNHTLYKGSQIGVEKAINTHADLKEWMQTQREFYHSYAKTQALSIETFIKGEVENINSVAKEKEAIAPLNNISIEIVKKRPQLSETFKNSNGLFNTTIAFVDIKEVCERYNLEHVLKGKDAEQLTTLISQSMNDLKNLTSWSSLLSLGKEGDALKEQAILSTVLSAYAKEENGFDNSFHELASSRRMGFLMARQCIQDPQKFDVYVALSHAEKLEKAFKDKITLDPDQKVSAFTFGDIDKTVIHYNHLCEAAFGKKLPLEMIDHLKDKVIDYTKVTPAATPVNTHQHLTQVLMTHELYKATNVHVERELTTHADVNKLFTEQRQYQQLHGQMQSMPVHQFEKENIKCRGGGMSL